MDDDQVYDLLLQSTCSQTSHPGRRLWEELRVKWPDAYWDDWLREPAQRKNRHIIRPEVGRVMVEGHLIFPLLQVCRTYHIGVRGVSRSQYSKVSHSRGPLRESYPIYVNRIIQ